MDYEAVIGLEVHAQIHTHSKMFCACPVVEDTGDIPPNTYVCPVCLALPGALPVVNRRAVEMGMLTGLALHCALNEVNVFARKSYFYPDLPKGYQISQYDLPLASNGYLDIEVEERVRRIRIRRAHLEEDTAKLYHLADGRVLVDCNRAGAPLLEIVTAPDMRTVEEVRAYATRLRTLLVYLGVNTGDMEKGMMRFEANVSLRPRGSTELGRRVEIKNLNSFRALTRSVAYEIHRQSALLDAGGVVAQETLGWNEREGCTYSQRSKEQAPDYRYFPEPDIPPLHLDPAWIAVVQAELPELPAERRQRLVTHYALCPSAAELLTGDRVRADYFEAAVKMGAELGLTPQDLANWITGELFRLLNETGTPLAACRATPEHLVTLLFLVQKGAISVSAAKKVLDEVFVTGEAPNTVVKRLGLAQMAETESLRAIAAEVVEQNVTQAAQYLAGKATVLGWFVGQVMRASQGKANPAQARAMLQELLEQQRSGRS